MNLTNLIESGTKDLGVRFNLVGLFPSTVLLLFVLALYWSGAPAHAPDLRVVYQRIQSLGTKESVLLLVAILAFSLVIHPLQLSLVKMLEGYWSSFFPISIMKKWGTEWHRKRRQRLDEATRTRSDSRPPEDKQERMSAAAHRLRSFYPSEERLLPTTLGNVLRAAEDFPNRRYGLDGVVLWPRLYPLLPDKMTNILADQRNQLDLAARFSGIFLVATITSFAFLYKQTWWLSVPAATLFLAWLSYKGAVAAALAYGNSIQTAYDLYRFDLLKALHLPLPVDRDSEKKSNRELSDFLRQGLAENFKYEHPPKSLPPKG